MKLTVIHKAGLSCLCSTPTPTGTILYSVHSRMLPNSAKADDTFDITPHDALSNMGSYLKNITNVAHRECLKHLGVKVDRQTAYKLRLIKLSTIHIAKLRLWYTQECFAVRYYTLVDLRDGQIVAHGFNRDKVYNVKRYRLHETFYTLTSEVVNPINNPYYVEFKKEI